MEDYSTLSGIYDFVQQVARYGEIPPRCVIDDFVQRVARYGEHYSIIVACILMHDRSTHGTLFKLFRVFTISCNKLHATGALFYIVACILMHERFHLGTE